MVLTNEFIFFYFIYFIYFFSGRTFGGDAAIHSGDIADQLDDSLYPPTLNCIHSSTFKIITISFFTLSFYSA